MTSTASSLTIPATKFRNNFSEYLDEAANKGKTIYIKKGKKVIVKIMSVDAKETKAEPTKPDENIVDKMFGMANFGLPRKLLIKIAEDPEYSLFGL
jgi:prevent-host-death family protein